MKRAMTPIWVLFVLIILFYPVFCFAETSTSGAVGAGVAKTEKPDDDKITMDLKGADINEFFKMLSVKSGITIVTTPEIQGRITVFIDHLSFTEALDVAVTMLNFAYERKANVVKVMTAAEYEKLYGKKFGERKETRTYKLTYAKPANVVTVITALKSDLGKIIVDESTGTIIITDTPQSLEILERTIKELDQSLESVVFDINYARFADLKGYLNDLITPGVGQIIVDERSGKVVVTDLPQRLSRIRKLMEEFDEASRQVLITGEIIEITMDDKFQSGINWDEIFSRDGKQSVNFVGNFPVAPALSSYGKISVGTINKDHNRAIINMLNEYGTTKILTRPSIVALNKEEAKLLVGTREAYITGSQSQSGSGTTVTSENAEFIDVGVKLSVIPTIGADGFITMKIKPEISSVTSYLTTDISKVPIVQTSQSESVVKVKNGSMIVIAGLMKNTDTNDINGLPKLGRVPFLGGLFSNKTKDKAKTELVIFITPTIVSGADKIRREGIDEDK